MITEKNNNKVWIILHNNKIYVYIDELVHESDESAKVTLIPGLFNLNVLAHNKGIFFCSSTVLVDISLSIQEPAGSIALNNKISYGTFYEPKLYRDFWSSHLRLRTLIIPKVKQ